MIKSFTVKIYWVVPDKLYPVERNGEKEEKKRKIY